MLYQPKNTGTENHFPREDCTLFWYSQSLLLSLLDPVVNVERNAIDSTIRDRYCRSRNRVHTEFSSNRNDRRGRLFQSNNQHALDRYRVFRLRTRQRVLGWVSRSRRLPFRIALLTAGIAIAAVIGTELAGGPVGAVDAPWDISEYLVPSHFLSFCVAWMLSIVVANLDRYSPWRKGLFIGTGLTLILLPPLALVLSDGYALTLALPIWVLSSVVVVIFAGLYVLPAFLLHKSLTET